MAENKRLVVTREGLQRMKEELEYKETTEKMRIAEQLKVAISYGDLSENAEYDAAKNDQAALEQRITELKAMIENAVVVDESKINTDAVNFGTRVTIVDLEDEDEEEEYVIVGTSESDPANGKLSNESPVGAALIGAQGDAGKQQHAQDRGIAHLVAEGKAHDVELRNGVAALVCPKGKIVLTHLFLHIYPRVIYSFAPDVLLAIEALVEDSDAEV